MENGEPAPVGLNPEDGSSEINASPGRRAEQDSFAIGHGRKRRGSRLLKAVQHRVRARGRPPGPERQCDGRQDQRALT